jgi:flagellar hook-basal body complex protein FliE
MDISSISPLTTGRIDSFNTTQPTSALDKAAKSFGDVLSGLNESQMESDSLVQKLASGQDVDLHQVMIATEENDVNFRVVMAIRDKLVDAYREIMRMSV